MLLLLLLRATRATLYYLVIRVCMLLQAKSLCVNLMTVLATVTVVKILSSKRVQRAIAAGEAVPKSLVTNLEQTLDACTQSSLPIPGELQALALRHTRKQTE